MERRKTYRMVTLVCGCMRLSFHTCQSFTMAIPMPSKLQTWHFLATFPRSAEVIWLEGHPIQIFSSPNLVCCSCLYCTHARTHHVSTPLTSWSSACCVMWEPTYSRRNLTWRSSDSDHYDNTPGVLQLSLMDTHTHSSCINPCYLVIQCLLRDAGAHVQQT